MAGLSTLQLTPVHDQDQCQVIVAPMPRSRPYEPWQGFQPEIVQSDGRSRARFTAEELD
jgi:hypothetical protein